MIPIAVHENCAFLEQKMNGGMKNGNETEEMNDDTFDGNGNGHVEQMGSNKNEGREKKNDFVEMMCMKEMTEKRSCADLKKRRSSWSNVNCCTLYGKIQSKPLIE